MLEQVQRKIEILNGRPPFSEVIRTFNDQSIKPPGNDPSIASFNASLVALCKSDFEISSFLADQYHMRANISPVHFVNLTFRAVQYIQLYVEQGRDHLAYRYFDSPDQWIDRIQRVFGEHKNVTTDILQNKDTVTTIYQRYAGPRSLIGRLFPDQKIRIADLGCGANHGLRGIDLNEPFGTIVDETPDSKFSQSLSLPVSIEDALAIDSENFESPDANAWYVACSFYPKELDNVAHVKELESRLKRSKRVRFMQTDLLEAGLPEPFFGHFNVVILSTMLYQHTPGNQQKILEEAVKATKRDGIVIVQDFAEKDSASAFGIKFTDSWFNGYGYRTFVIRPKNPSEVLEVFRWSDGRCTQVKDGEDFEKVFES